LKEIAARDRVADVVSWMHVISACSSAIRILCRRLRNVTDARPTVA
jgi:hypothetical protein